MILPGRCDRQFQEKLLDCQSASNIFHFFDLLGYGFSLLKTVGTGQGCFPAHRMRGIDFHFWPHEVGAWRHGEVRHLSAQPVVSYPGEPAVLVVPASVND